MNRNATAPEGTVRCGKCGQPGHNKRTCGRPPEPPKPPNVPSAPPASPIPDATVKEFTLEDLNPGQRQAFEKIRKEIDQKHRQKEYQRKRAEQKKLELQRWNEELREQLKTPMWRRVLSPAGEPLTEEDEKQIMGSNAVSHFEGRKALFSLLTRKIDNGGYLTSTLQKDPDFHEALTYVTTKAGYQHAGYLFATRYHTMPEAAKKALQHLLTCYDNHYTQQTLSFPAPISGIGLAVLDPKELREEIGLPWKPVKGKGWREETRPYNPTLEHVRLVTRELNNKQEKTARAKGRSSRDASSAVETTGEAFGFDMEPEPSGFFARRKHRKKVERVKAQEIEMFHAETQTRYETVLADYGKVYTDVLQLADMPLLSSGGFCEQTARFEKALITAQDIHKNRAASAQQKREATVELELSWKNAKEYASTVGRNTLDERTLQTVSKAKGLLNIAADHSQPEVYRRTCAIRALDLLKQGIIIPPAAEKKLFADLKLQITAR